jgi:hypothetical protein
MKKFLLIALPIVGAVGAGAFLAYKHKDEVANCCKCAKNWGIEKLDKAYNAACKCAEKYDINPDDIYENL